jgi:nucleotide-binding universal stress UspA family protein
MFNNILVCLDGTKHSKAILPFVAQLAETFSSKVLLMNVFIIPTLLYGRGKAEIDPDQLIEISEYHQDTAGYLKSAAESLSEKGLDVECIIVEGTVEESIIACAEAYKISLIAMVSYGHGVLRKLVQGSTTDFVIRKLGVPILLLNPEAPVLSTCTRI